MSFTRVIDNGTYYYPAWRHYGSNHTDVVCDRCLKHNLTACIGYEEQDLCLRCADEITDSNITYPLCRCGRRHCNCGSNPVRPIYDPYIEPYVVPVPIHVPVRFPVPCCLPDCIPDCVPDRVPNCSPNYCQSDLADMCDEIRIIKKKCD